MSVLATGDGFDWYPKNGEVADESIILSEQPRTAVYTNGVGDVVIRQERGWDEDSDTLVIITRNNVEAIIWALIGLLNDDEKSPELLRLPPPVPASERTTPPRKPSGGGKQGSML